MQTVSTEVAGAASRGGAERTALPDEEIVIRVRAGETELFEILMRRYNQQLYRAARAILPNDAEAEDAVQQAYLNAYRHLDQFEGRAQLATWLTRIAIHEALARRRRGRDRPADGEDAIAAVESAEPDPERQAYVGELRGLLESAIDRLPIGYRCVFVLREVDGVSTADTAARLQVTEGTVKTRLHRARHVLQQTLKHVAPTEAFRFDGQRCDRLVAAVMRQLTEGTVAIDAPATTSSR